MMCVTASDCCRARSTNASGEYEGSTRTAAPESRSPSRYPKLRSPPARICSNTSCIARIIPAPGLRFRGTPPLRRDGERGLRAPLRQLERAAGQTNHERRGAPEESAQGNAEQRIKGDHCTPRERDSQDRNREHQG